MSLVEQTLFGTRDKVETAIERLQQFCPSEGYYLAFSGGKDSTAIYRLAEMAGVAFDAHYNPTTVDPPELVRFIKRHYPAVAFNRPERSMWEAIRWHGWPPTRGMRYCCAEFKERGGAGRLVVTGIRWQESVRRAKRHMIETCYRDAATTFLHPIIDWTEKDVWEFLGREDLPHCSLYDEGFRRIGCVLCPMAGQQERDIARWPHIAEMYRRTFDQVVAQRVARGQRCTFTSGEEMFRWWIDRDAHAVADEQLTLFE